ncbi:MAG: glycosyltransferase, partial [Rhodospirillales bacterium]
HHSLERMPDGPFCTGFVMGAAMLWRMDVWRALGGFDEAIFLYGEDADLSLRATQAGFSIVIEPGAVVKHLGGQSEQPSKEQQWRRHWQMTWGGLYFSAKWASADQARRDAWRIVRKHAAKALFYTLICRFNRAYTNFARTHAAWSYLQGRPSWRGR